MKRILNLLLVIFLAVSTAGCMMTSERPIIAEDDSVKIPDFSGEYQVNLGFGLAINKVSNNIYHMDTLPLGPESVRFELRLWPLAAADYFIVQSGSQGEDYALQVFQRRGSKLEVKMITKSLAETTLAMDAAGSAKLSDEEKQELMKLVAAYKDLLKKHNIKTSSGDDSRLKSGTNFKDLLAFFDEALTVNGLTVDSYSLDKQQ